MGSLKDPKTWIPHINPKDCSQKVCNIYCTKWCKYLILPSPPPPQPKDDLGGATLSPVVIVIIALIGSFFVLIAYYVFISRYCSRNMINESSIEINQEARNPETRLEGRDQVDDHSNHVPWLVLGKGLDEALIKSITMCKYKKGDGLVSCTDCSVCLGEFQENESIRLLPKCSHAFHVYCIDTWLKTHSNCPLCRANVCFDVKGYSPLISPPTPPLPRSPPPPQPPPPPPPCEIREEGRRRIGRSKSMDCLCETRVSIAGVDLFLNQTEEMARQEVQFRSDGRSSVNVLEGNSMDLTFVDVSHFGTKRSYSSGRYVFN